MRELIPVVITAIIFLAIGVICLFRPEKVQEYGLKWSDRGIGKINPFLSWMKTKSYILSLRIIGILSVGVFVLALITILRMYK